MPYSDLLQTISEVAAALAGFTAILVAFRRGNRWSRSEFVGLVHFLQLAVGVVLLALMPLLLGSLEPIASLSWRISNAVLGAYHVFVVAWLLMRPQHAPAFQAGVPAWVRFATIPVGAASVILNFWVAIGGWPTALMFAYLFGLIWLLAMALVNFVLIIFSTVRQDAE